MWRRSCGVPVVSMVACNLASCDTAARSAAGGPAPEAEQVVSAALKEFYMAPSAAPPQSPAQQKVVLQKTEEASASAVLGMTEFLRAKGHDLGRTNENQL
jgi:hypothetical protein